MRILIYKLDISEDDPDESDDCDDNNSSSPALTMDISLDINTDQTTSFTQLEISQSEQFNYIKQLEQQLKESQKELKESQEKLKLVIKKYKERSSKIKKNHKKAQRQYRNQLDKLQNEVCIKKNCSNVLSKIFNTDQIKFLQKNGTKVRRWSLLFRYYQKENSLTDKKD